MNQPEEPKGVISIWTALVLYAILLGFSIATLKGIALVVALIIVGGVAIKTYVHFLRSRIR